MSTYRLDIAYDGGRFNGWARQPGIPTIQAEIEAALARLFGPGVELSVAGRTDAGVHALGQVASFSATKSPPADLRRALNALTPPAISITAAGRAPEWFNARRDALSRRYRYRLRTAAVPDPFLRGRVLEWPAPLDRDGLWRCATATVGPHDFTAFTPTDTKHRRFQRMVSAAAWVEAGEELHFEIEADSFMRSMVRVLVGTMLEVGAGRRSVEDFSELLEGRPRPRGGETAPAKGLYLVGVGYPGSCRIEPLERSDRSELGKPN